MVEFFNCLAEHQAIGVAVAVFLFLSVLFIIIKRIIGFAMTIFFFVIAIITALMFADPNAAREYLEKNKKGAVEEIKAIEEKIESTSSGLYDQIKSQMDVAGKKIKSYFHHEDSTPRKT